MTQHIQSSNNALQLLRLPDVLALYPVSRSSWWAGVKEGRYPAGIKLGPRTTAWRLSDIQALINTCAEQAGMAQ